MSKPLPERFDPDLMARGGTRHEAVVPIRRFERLAAVLGSDEGEVRVAAGFAPGKDHVIVTGRVRADFRLRCQRCLEPMTLDVDEPFELVCVASEAAAQDLAPELDPVVLDDTGRTSVVAMLEDELILHVPLIARHSDDARCVPVTASFGGEAIVPEAGKARPFDALKELKLH